MLIKVGPCVSSVTGFSTLQSLLKSILNSPSWLLVPVLCVLELEHRANIVHSAVLLLKSFVTLQQRESLLSLHCELASSKSLIPPELEMLTFWVSMFFPGG